MVEQNNGNLIVACGDAHFFVEVDRKSGKILRITDNAVIAASGCEFNFVAQIEQLSTGNLLVCNWNGHLRDGQTIQPSLL